MSPRALAQLRYFGENLALVVTGFVVAPLAAGAVYYVWSAVDGPDRCNPAPLGFVVISAFVVAPGLVWLAHWPLRTGRRATLMVAMASVPFALLCGIVVAIAWGGSHGCET